ncbi:hypothetical protein F5X97DRAFT_325786 [Nemania serpens]|nr:hypothetical protein F5X97DRAFT_325786 [Nemania serpens]
MACNYSRGVPVGRPRGSKNKRALAAEQGNAPKRAQVQPTANMSQEENIKTPNCPDTNTQDQHQLEAQSASYSTLAHVPEESPTPFFGEFVRDFGPNITPGPKFASIFDTAHDPVQDLDLDLLFLQVFAPVPDTTGLSLTATVNQSSGIVGGNPELSVQWEDAGEPNGSSNESGPTNSPSQTIDLSDPGSSNSIGCARGSGLGVLAFRSPPSCPCVRQHAQLIYQLGALQQSDDGVRIDSILEGVQLAQRTWTSLMQCSNHHHQDGQHEVFYLFATSIRILLTSVRKASIAYFSTTGNVQNPDPTNRVPHCSNDRVSIGSFELTGDIKAKVVAVLLRSIVQTIEPMLLYLLKCMGHPAPNLSSRDKNCDWASNPERPAINSSPHSGVHTTARADIPSLMDLSKDDVFALLHTLQATKNNLE